VLLLVALAMLASSAGLLVTGIVGNAPVYVYLSLSCAGVAALSLAVVTFLMRRRRQPASGITLVAFDAGEPAVDAAAAFPIEGYDHLRVVQIVPLLNRLDQAGLLQVWDRETAGKARVTILGRIDELLARPVPTCRVRRARPNPLTL